MKLGSELTMCVKAKAARERRICDVCKKSRPCAVSDAFLCVY